MGNKYTMQGTNKKLHFQSIHRTITVRHKEIKKNTKFCSLNLKTNAGGRPRCIWEDNIEINLRDNVCEIVVSIPVAQNRSNDWL